MNAKDELVRTLWTSRGARRLPTSAALDRVLAKLSARELEAICERHPFGPVYLLPTTRWVKALSQIVNALGARRVLEVAAGDGFLSRCLARVVPELEVVATDSGAWTKPEARMSDVERRRLARTSVPGLRLGANVERLEATKAIARFKPDVVLASWLPPGALLERVIRSPVKYVLEIGAAGGVTSGAWHWRFAHEFLEGPVESLARCRLDARPERGLHSRVTLYFGAAHPDFAVERVRPGDWLWQFRPTR